jgi:hypothetical protein
MRKLKLSMGILAIAFATLTVASCKDAKKEHNNEDGHHMEASHDNSDGHHGGDKASSKANMRDIEANTQKNMATTPIVDAYIQIKNALVIDDKDDAAKGAKALLNAFSEFDMTKLTGETHNEYMEIAESAKEQAEHIIENPIDHQREHFETLSTDISDLITLLGTDKTLYLDFCPMKKVTWLSETKAIKNPFYGSDMLTCGNVKKQIN